MSSRPSPASGQGARNARCPHMVHCHAASYLRGVAYGTRWALGVKSIDGFPHLGHGPGPISPPVMSRAPLPRVGCHAPHLCTTVVQFFVIEGPSDAALRAFIRTTSLACCDRQGQAPASRLPRVVCWLAWLDSPSTATRRPDDRRWTLRDTWVVRQAQRPLFGNTGCGDRDGTLSRHQ